MKKRILILLVLVFTPLLICQAKNGGNKNHKPPPDTRILITSVDSTKQTIVVTDQGAHTTTTYAVGLTTTIELDGTGATFKDLKPGLEVRSTQVNSADSSISGPPVLIDLDVKTSVPPTPKSSK